MANQKRNMELKNEILRILANNLTDEEKAILISRLFKETVTREYNVDGVYFKSRWKLLDIDYNDLYADPINTVLFGILRHLKNSEPQNHQDFIDLDNFIKLSLGIKKPKKFFVDTDDISYQHIDTAREYYVVTTIPIPQPRVTNEDLYILKLLAEFGY